MTFKVIVVNKFSENVLHKGRNGAGVKAELFLAFFTCLGIHVPRDAFAANSWCEPPLVEVVVYHGDASRAALAYLALVGIKFLLRRGFRVGGFTCLGRLHALRIILKIIYCQDHDTRNDHYDTDHTI